MDVNHTRHLWRGFGFQDTPSARSANRRQSVHPLWIVCILSEPIVVDAMLHGDAANAAEVGQHHVGCRAKFNGVDRPPNVRVNGIMNAGFARTRSHCAMAVYFCNDSTIDICSNPLAKSLQNMIKMHPKVSPSTRKVLATESSVAGL